MSYRSSYQTHREGGTFLGAVLIAAVLSAPFWAAAIVVVKLVNS